MKQLINFLANSQISFINFIRVSIFIVMVWIGGLKVCQYEADGIVPLVSNSPFMSFLYNDSNKTEINDKGETVAAYKVHMNKEGQMVEKNIAWNKENGTYLFAYGLGTVIVVIGIMTLLGIWLPKIGMWGGLLTFGMALVTLSFLITTKEAWVPNLGGDLPTPHFGFPYLSIAGRLIIKDIIMMAGGLIIASDSAKAILKNYR